MDTVFHSLLATQLASRREFNKIWFAGDNLTPPQFSYQVDFSRLELVIDGEYRNQIEVAEQGIVDIRVLTGDALYIPANCWNKPCWDSDCTLLSLLFGRRQLGFSLVSKKKHEKGFFAIRKGSIPTRTGHALDSIIEALNALASESHKSPMDEHLLLALLSYSQSMISEPVPSPKKHSEALYQSICIYIQEHFHCAITRANIANRFNISPNHLSRMFRQQGHMTLADYITWVRIDRAKFILRKYPLRLNEVATRCGFQDVNYFFRVFKLKTGHTPSEYRCMN